MSTHTAAGHVAADQPRALVSAWRLRLIAAIGPLAALAAVGWAIVQPDRVTLLHPHGQGFWWLVVEPPLWAFAAGALFHRFVARPLLDDLDEEVGRAAAG
jgi:hypothetical protein